MADATESPKGNNVCSPVCFLASSPALRKIELGRLHSICPLPSTHPGLDQSKSRLRVYEM